MADDGRDDFRPRFGRARNRGGVRTGSFLRRVLQQASLAGGKGVTTGMLRRGASGAYVSRDGRVLRHHGRRLYLGPAQRRVIIKARVVKLKTSGMEVAQLHLHYLQRDGVDEERGPGRLYDAVSVDADGKAFLQRSAGDRHQFRFIVSPEDGVEMASLKPFVRDLMRAMEEDLGTRLDWVAVDHFDTGQPHTHIVLRGRDERGDDLVISRDYISYGMRHRASELLTLELGPQTTREIIDRFRRQVGQDRFTDLDRALIREAEEGIVQIQAVAGTPADRVAQAMRVKRLRHLERRGLARQTGSGAWELSADLEATLRRAGERGDIIKTMHRGMKRAGMEAGAAAFSIHDPAARHAAAVTGRVIDRGLHDELNDVPYILVDAADGRVHYIALDPGEDMEDFPPGAIVEVHPADIRPGKADRLIAEVAKKNAGLYSQQAHQTHDPRASERFIRAHVNRLEALRRSGLVRRLADGSWEIPPEFEERLAARATGRGRLAARVATLSFLSLEDQVRARGATWLDRQLLAERPLALQGDRFGADAMQALQRRREYLVEQGLAERQKTGWRYRRNLLLFLQGRELAAAGEQLAREKGLAHVPAREGKRVRGVYSGVMRLASGKFAVIETSREFTLVPWRPVLERRRGQGVAAIVRGASVSFEFGRKRGMGID